MDHWFLCARDVMWLAFSLAPLFVCRISKEEEDGYSLIMVAVGIHFTGILCLYMGLIR